MDDDLVRPPAHQDSSREWRIKILPEDSQKRAKQRREIMLEKLSEAYQISR